MLLGETHSGTSFVNLSDAAFVSNFGKKRTSAIQVLMGFNEFSSGEQQRSQIVLDECHVARVTHAVPVIACCCEFDKGAVDVVAATFGLSEILQDQPKLVVEVPFKIMVVTVFE